MTLTLISCSDPAPPSGNASLPDSTHTASDTISTTHIINLESFVRIPSAIDGCSGLFKLESDSAGTAYVFVTDLQTKAFIQINGELQALTRDTTVANDTTRMHQLYRGGSLEVELNTSEQSRLGDELWQYKGNLILRINQQERTYEIIGEVGC